MSLTTDQYAEACALWLEGFDTLEISKALGVPEAEVWAMTKPPLIVADDVVEQGAVA